jgi:hypothetical protein
MVARWRGDLLVILSEGDTLPALIPLRRMIHMVDKGDKWSVGFLCPCGCGETIELLLPAFIKPHWALTVDDIGRPTLTPSIWRKEGCRSHFFVKGGRIIWV